MDAAAEDAEAIVATTCNAAAGKVEPTAEELDVTESVCEVVVASEGVACETAAINVAVIEAADDDGVVGGDSGGGCGGGGAEDGQVGGPEGGVSMNKKRQAKRRIEKTRRRESYQERHMREVRVLWDVLQALPALVPSLDVSLFGSGSQVPSAPQSSRQNNSKKEDGLVDESQVELALAAFEKTVAIETPYRSLPEVFGIPGGVEVLGAMLDRPPKYQEKYLGQELSLLAKIWGLARGGGYGGGAVVSREGNSETRNVLHEEESQVPARNVVSSNASADQLGEASAVSEAKALVAAAVTLRGEGGEESREVDPGASDGVVGCAACGGDGIGQDFAIVDIGAGNGCLALLATLLIGGHALLIDITLPPDELRVELKLPEPYRSRVLRITGDIAAVDVARDVWPVLRRHGVRHAVVVAKHLCGVGTDLAATFVGAWRRSDAAASSSEGVKLLGAAFATCCGHKIAAGDRVIYRDLHQRDAYLARLTSGDVARLDGLLSVCTRCVAWRTTAGALQNRIIEAQVRAAELFEDFLQQPRLNLLRELFPAATEVAFVPAGKSPQNRCLLAGTVDGVREATSHNEDFLAALVTARDELLRAIGGPLDLKPRGFVSSKYEYDGK
eukprot:TRINITY_DN60833_c0_g1_i1.p1 TRINITY_DN60833_c0_g1~~TRINITY_DN60833_c0_g1_i1.p1  ORF type:complete len:647 (-),score=140.19 TRINITY_DN60833_c0_g1_i1:36-1883(-)